MSELPVVLLKEVSPACTRPATFLLSPRLAGEAARLLSACISGRRQDRPSRVPTPTIQTLPPLASLAHPSVRPLTFWRCFMIKALQHLPPATPLRLSTPHPSRSAGPTHPSSGATTTWSQREASMREELTSHLCFLPARRSLFQQLPVRDALVAIHECCTQGFPGR